MMAGYIKFEKYNSKELHIMVLTMFPMAVLMNYFLFGSDYFSDLRVFAWATLVTFIVLCLAFFIYGQIAVSLRHRFPHEHEVYRRLFLTITVFVLLTGVYLSILCRAYDLFHFMGYSYDESNFGKCFLTFAVMNVFLTFLNEGVSRFESYRVTLYETEQLKKEYMQSQLLGLKSQMNPHFLFNGLNTLSSLIHEDADKAEDFLDHMSKVYRYLLRNNEEQLVSLQTEINFIRSYYFLLKARYAEGLQLAISIDTEQYEQFLPPLTLQMLIENILTFNEASKANPLLIEISTKGLNELVIKNTVQLKLNCSDCFDESIENISNKFKLLCQKEVEIIETQTYRTIQLPLLKTKELTEA
jgi:two-component system, LytTR family, sensor kinase